MIFSLFKRQLLISIQMLTKYRQIAGGEYVGFNNAVFLSEQATADRNFALSYYMKEKG